MIYAEIIKHKIGKLPAFDRHRCFRMVIKRTMCRACCALWLVAAIPFHDTIVDRIVATHDLDSLEVLARSVQNIVQHNVVIFMLFKSEVSIDKAELAKKYKKTVRDMPVLGKR